MATTTDLEKLVINYLTQDQYDDAREAGTLNANELYLTPDTGSTGGTVTSIATGGGLTGGPITSSGTISHDDTSSQSSVSNSGRTYIQSVTLDTYGHVTGLTSASESVTNSDEKLGTDAVTSGTTYYIVAGTNTTGAERKKYDASGIAYKATNGTANGTNGEALLTLGNSTASTSANWKAGKIFLYSSSAYGGTLVPEAVTSSSKTWTLPNKTGTIALTSDIPDTSSFITVDEKLKWTASTSSNTYYPLQSTSTATTSTASTLNAVSFYQYYNTAGGYRRLDLGNATSFTSTGGAYGTIRLYGAPATYYGDLVPGVLSTSATGRLTANRTWTFPDASGTVALTSNIPTVPTKTSDLTNDGDGTSAFARMSDIGSLGGGTITKVKTTAGTHTTIDVSTGNAEFNVPTKTSHLTNDSGFVTSSGVTSIATTSPISGGTITGTGTISHATSGVGTATTTAGFYKFKYDTYGHVTGVSSVTASDITGLVTIPTNTDENVKSTAVTAATTNYITGSTTSTTTTGGLSKHASAVLYTTADSGTSGYTQLRLGNTTATTSAGGKEGQIRLYGTNATYYLDLKPGAIASSSKTITFPNKTGTVALTSDIPDMSDYAGMDDLPTITLNGTETFSPNFYAPTSAGTDGYYLKSNGSGAPTWAAIETGGTGTVTTWYGTCGTTASTTAKVVTCSNFALSTGAIIGILFTTANTAATPTLNVNSTGAKSIYVGTSTPSSTTNVLKWSANTMLYFMYDGTYFRFITAVAAASVVPPTGANTWYGTSSTTATTAAKTSTIDNYVLTKGSLVSVTFSTANTYVAGAITLNINSTGAKTIYYNNAATSTTNTLLWDAGETLTFMYSGSYYYFIGKSAVTAGEIVRW